MFDIDLEGRTAPLAGMREMPSYGRLRAGIKGEITEYTNVYLGCPGLLSSIFDS